MRGVIINKGTIGAAVNDNADAISGLLVNGPSVAAAEGVIGFANGDVLEITSLKDAELLGIDEAYDTDNDVRVFRHISEFYRMAGEGTYLFVLVAPEASDMATMLNTNGQSLVAGANGQIRRLAVAYNPDDLYAPTVVDGMEEVVRNAIPAAQTLHDWSWETDRPLNIFIEGRGIADSVAGVLDLKDIQVDGITIPYTNVSVCIAQDFGYAETLVGDAQKFADVGTMLGVSASISVNQSIGEVESLDLSDAPKGKWLVAGLSSHKKITEVEADLSTFDQYGYVFAISYTGISGYRFNNDHVCAAEIVDQDGYMNENTIALGLTYAKAARRLRTALLPKVKTVVPVDASTGLLPVGIRKYFEGIGDSEFAAMVTAGEISGGETKVDPNSNLLTGDKVLKVSFTVVPTGTINEIQGSINLKTSL